MTTTTTNPLITISKYTMDDDFVVDNDTELVFLLVGGGGAGGEGTRAGSGGACGGILTASGLFGPGTYRVTIGSGGTCPTTSRKAGNNGEKTVLRFPDGTEISAPGGTGRCFGAQCIVSIVKKINCSSICKTV